MVFARRDPSGARPSVYALDGDDFVVGGVDYFFPTLGTQFFGTSLATAYSLENSTNQWTTFENALVEDHTVPHLTIVHTPTAGSGEAWLQVYIEAGKEIVLDIDSWGSVPVDSVLTLTDYFGTVLDSKTISELTDGGEGSRFTSDPFLRWTTASTGNHHISLSPPAGQTFDGTEVLVLNVSVEGHATSTTSYHLPLDTVHGGAGADLIIGGPGSQKLWGGDAAAPIDGEIDRLVGGSGDDVYHVDSLDVVVELAGGGSDTLFFYDSIYDARALENIEMIRNGVIGNSEIFAPDYDVTVWGNIRDDIFHAGAGATTMFGGEGNDTYYVTTFTDVVLEFSGNDTVYAGQDLTAYDLPDGVETLVGQIGPNAYRYTYKGNDLDNLITLEPTVAGIERSFVVIYGGEGDDTVDLRGLDAGFHPVELSAALHGDDGNDTLYGSAYATNTLRGGSGDDRLYAGLGDDHLDGGEGADLMSGGDGDDRYFVDNVGDIIVEAAGGGLDIVGTTASFTLPDHVENAFHATGAGDITIIGNELDNFLSGRAGDSLFGGEGFDTLDNAGYMEGGPGGDTYIVRYGSTATIVEQPGEGYDILIIEGYADGVPDNVEEIRLTGVKSSTVVGSDNADLIIFDANAVNKRVESGDGNDFIDARAVGSAGSTSIHAEAGNDVIYLGGGYSAAWLGSGEDTVFVSSGNVQIVVGDSADRIVLLGDPSSIYVTVDTAYWEATDTYDGIYLGNAAHFVGTDGDEFIYNVGNGDTAEGGLGDDRYFVDEAGATIVEGANGGNDSVVTNVDLYVLPENVENMVADDGGLTLFGNAGANIFTAMSTTAVNTYVGGDGDDYYEIPYNQSTIIEEAGGGYDTIKSGFPTFTLPDNVERLLGYAFKQILNGNALDNVIDGGRGDDEMFGGLGDDTYYVHSLGDRVTELFAEGTDKVFTSVKINTAEAGWENIETFELTGTETTLLGNDFATTLIANADLGSKIFGKGGNDFIIGSDFNDRLDGGDGNDTLTGNGGRDRLDGGRGIDVMIGGTGDDRYFVDDLADTVTELADEGTDQVRSLVNWTLGDHTENLRLRGSATQGIGNDLDNVLQAVAAGSTLRGNGGDDNLRGSNGGDFLFGNDGNDTINGRGGDDAINAGRGDDFVKGRAGEDTIHGGSGSDHLIGGKENDWLSGGSEQDILTGETGADTFAFADGDFAGLTAETADIITDFDQVEGDLIDLAAVDAITDTAEDDAFAFIGDAEFSGTAGELRFEQVDGNTMVFMDVDGDGAADYAIALTGIVSLTEADFVL